MSSSAACAIALVHRLKRGDDAFPATASGAGDAFWSPDDENGDRYFNLCDRQGVVGELVAMGSWVRRSRGDRLYFTC